MSVTLFIACSLSSTASPNKSYIRLLGTGFCSLLIFRNILAASGVLRLMQRDTKTSVSAISGLLFTASCSPAILCCPSSICALRPCSGIFKESFFIFGRFSVSVQFSINVLTKVFPSKTKFLGNYIQSYSLTLVKI